MNISNYIDAYNGLGSVYGKKGMYKEAEKVFLKLVGLTPKNYNAYYNLGLVYLK
jgi:pentatricopeptide repeat protein